MNIKQLEEIKEKIINNEIDIEVAKEEIFKYKNKNLWHTKEWKELRCKLLKDKCEQCGESENLVMQHKSHPRTYGIIKRDISSEYAKKLKEKYKVDELVKQSEVLTYITLNYEYREKYGCPICESVNIKEYKTKYPKYMCNRCKNRFESPKKLSILVEKSNTRTMKSTEDEVFKKVKNKIYKEKIKEKKELIYKNQIEKETLIQLIDEKIKYLSMVDTVTYCKKCAYLEDLKNQDLCPVCNKNYKTKYYEMCYECKFGKKYYDHSMDF